MWHYDLLGLSVRSEIRLAADEVSAPLTRELCEVELAVPSDTSGFAQAELIARLGSDGEGYEVRRSNGLLLARFLDGAVLLAVDIERGKLRASGDPEALAYVIPNAGLALYLIARGSSVLHASAVEWRGRAHAVLGGTQAGKTTVAALLCGAGAALVTDDTLRVHVENSSVTCWGGTRSLRLRPSSSEVARCLPEAPSAPSGDGRVVLRVPCAKLAQWTLDSLWFPRADAAVKRPELVALPRSTALERLLEATRLRGLSEPTLLAQQFRVLAELARSLPAFEARLPWGPPFECGWGEVLLRSLRTPPPQR